LPTSKKLDGSAQKIHMLFSASFVSLWLVPRLTEFKTLHPNIVHISKRVSETKMRSTSADWTLPLA